MEQMQENMRIKDVQMAELRTRIDTNMEIVNRKLMEKIKQLT